MQDKRLTIQAKAIYGYFCSYAGTGKTAFPRMTKIIADLGIGKNTYYTHFNLLKEFGYIKAEQEKNKSGQFNRNIYTLMEALPIPQNKDTAEKEVKTHTEPFPCLRDTAEPYTADSTTNNNNNKNNSFNINTPVKSGPSAKEDRQDEDRTDDTIQQIEVYTALTLPDNRPTQVIQSKLLKFIEYSDELPILMLASHDDITAPLLSRMKHTLKKSAVKVRGELHFMPIHKGYQNYVENNKYPTVKGMIDYALNNCPDLLLPIVTNPNGDVALQKLDNLISALTGGKTYIDLLNAAPDPAANVPTKTKYLSLSLRRADLARFKHGRVRNGNQRQNYGGIRHEDFKLDRADG